MRVVRTLLVGLVMLVGGARAAEAQRWQDATARCVGTTAEWSNKLDVADLDGDGEVDLLVANGGDYDSAGTPEPARVWRNLGDWGGAAPVHCTEISADAVQGFTGLSRVIKAADLDGDGDLDIVTGGAYQTQLRLFTDGTDATAQLPQQPTSVGDLEVGDVDGDGDLDMVLADWGATAPASPSYVGGRTRLYLNDGTGHFTDATADRMPATLVGWSWDLTLADVDGDFALDVLVSCKACTGSYVFHNDGAGTFTEVAGALPPRANNYALEPMDIDGDGDLDLATINDGASGRNRVLVNRGDGTFADETATRLAGTANPREDDNAPVFLDVDSDGDADMLVGSLSGPDRLLLNDGTGVFTLAPGAATPDDTPGSLGLAVVDLDGDGRLDVVQAQGEVAFPERVQLGSADGVAIDTAPPVIAAVSTIAASGGIVRARVHDHQSPSRLHDWRRVWLVTDDAREIDLHWAGEYLWQSTVDGPVASYHVCADDRRGNHACGAEITATAAPVDGAPIDADDGVTMTEPGGCCGTSAGGTAPGSLLLAIALGLRAARRRTA